jgi:hypothetical protein
MSETRADLFNRKGTGLLALMLDEDLHGNGGLIGNPELIG